MRTATETEKKAVALCAITGIQLFRQIWDNAHASAEVRAKLVDMTVEWITLAIDLEKASR